MFKTLIILLFAILSSLLIYDNTNLQAENKDLQAYSTSLEQSNRQIRQVLSGCIYEMRNNTIQPSYFNLTNNSLIPGWNKSTWAVKNKTDDHDILADSYFPIP